jgi:hypothetical protein
VREAASSWSVGERDAFLLAVHQANFGDRLDLLAECPACAEAAAFQVEIDALLAPQDAADWPLRVTFQDRVFLCRRPVTRDLAAAWAGTILLEEARRRLVQACVRAEESDGAASDGDTIDEAAVEAVCTALAAADPKADIRFALTCPACACAWEALFDPPYVLWRALDAWARTELDDVRRLAHGYGWSERDILSMSRPRRQFYLDAVR